MTGKIINLSSGEQAVRACELRDMSGAPLMSCVQALKLHDWDISDAAEWLRNPPSLEQRITSLEQQVKELQLATSKLVD